MRCDHDVTVDDTTRAEVRFSYQTLVEQPADEIVRAIELADELGFYACYAADRRTIRMRGS